jgi:hypothetical protein
VEGLESAVVEQEVLDLLLRKLLRETPDEDLQRAFLDFGRDDTQGRSVELGNGALRFDRTQLVIVFGPSDTKVQATETNSIELNHRHCLFNRPEINKQKPFLRINKRFEYRIPSLHYPTRPL